MSPESKPLTKLNNSQSGIRNENGPASYLAEECEGWQALLRAQPKLMQIFLKTEALQLAETLMQPSFQVHFNLQPEVILRAKDAQATPVPAEQRDQMVGGLVDRLMRSNLNLALRQRLDELESASNEPTAIAAGLLRYSLAVALVHDLLPTGRSVRYLAVDGEEIPTLPNMDQELIESALTAASDAIAEESGETESGAVIVPYVPAARRFFLPQWIAFDDQDQLLVKSISEAEAYLASMQGFVRFLHTAVGLAPYMVADEIYQQKRYGMLGQLINQGRALARYQTRQMMDTIKRRAAAHDLNRGLSLSLPYFDDQTLEMKIHPFDVIPGGRVMFVPAIVVLAARKELAKVEQDTRLDRSTRKHLLAELQMIASEFETTTQNNS